MNADRSAVVGFSGIDGGIVTTEVMLPTVGDRLSHPLAASRNPDNPAETACVRQSVLGISGVLRVQGRPKIGPSVVVFDPVAVVNFERWPCAIHVEKCQPMRVEVLVVDADDNVTMGFTKATSNSANRLISHSLESSQESCLRTVGHQLPQSLSGETIRSSHAVASVKGQGVVRAGAALARCIGPFILRHYACA
jgi:hypothetical protein